MSFLWNRTFLSATKLSNYQSVKSISLQYAGHHVSSKQSYYGCRKEYLFKCFRSFHTTQCARLKSLFSEDQQKKIISFINERDPTQKIGQMRLRCLNKVIASIPNDGPLNNIDDLLGKYSLSASKAVTACNIILGSSEKSEEGVQCKATKKVSVPRKIMNLQKSISPQISNPVNITKFAAVVVTENYISYTVLERQGTQLWDSQKLCNWNVCEVPNDTSLPETIRKLWLTLPEEDVYVVQINPSRGANLLKQGQLYGATISVICAKNSFGEEMAGKVYQMNGRAPAKKFNFFIGNEIVSALTIVSRFIDTQGTLNSVDHVFSRSLTEVCIQDDAIARFRELNDDLREPLCQSLLLAKTFVELLRH